MSKDIKPCLIYDRLREWFDLYGNQNLERAKEEYSRALNEIYNYQQKDQQITELQKKLEEKDKGIEKLRKIHSIKDDVTMTEKVNGVVFDIEQIMIIQLLKYNYEMQINNLKQQLKSQPKEIVEKIKERVLKIDKTEIKTLENGYSTLYCDRPSVITILDDILEEYKGE